MVEIPSNVILLEDFIKMGIDGVSVGTNDLTMLLWVLIVTTPASLIFMMKKTRRFYGLWKNHQTCQK